MKNILITSAGRRVELVQAFIDQSRRLISGAKVYAIDHRAHLSSACQIADKTSSCPRIDDPNYLEFLLNYAKKENIGLIIPTIDTELLFLSENKALFKKSGTDVSISSEHLIASCRDKRKTRKIFESMDIAYPKIYSKDDIAFPCFAKPYDGSCSIGTRALKSQKDLTPIILENPKIIFMQLIGADYSEYTVDAYFSNGHLKCLVPRRRLEVRAGEISKGITVKSWLYDFLLSRFQFLEGASGCLTLQFFVDDQKKHCIGLEINPRFGGGYPLSYAAGANYPAWLIQEYFLNQSVGFFEDWEENLLMLRYDSMALVKNAVLI